MFGRVARHYDLLNHLLSANLDRRWRRRAAARLGDRPAGRVLDLCGGTGDLSIAVARGTGAATIVCCDFALPMLSRARDKFRRAGLGSRCVTVEGDGLHLPFPAGAFDAVTVGFGVRNLADMARGFREMYRVLRPGGSLIVLEFSAPQGAVLSRLYALYLQRVLPRLGDGISGAGGSYAYLARTIAEFPDAPTLAKYIGEAGFVDCQWQLLSRGIVAIHRATR
jgi:demethylmenaquinone methyltransferase/2-methoxy-6-polyprenyl-1,4-benzoquinol methylase